MATRNRLTDSGNENPTREALRQGKAVGAMPKAKATGPSKKPATSHRQAKMSAASDLSTKGQRSEKTAVKGPSASAKANQSKVWANRQASRATWKNSPEYKPIKTDELRTTNDNWGNAVFGEEYATKFEQIEKKPYNAYYKNNYLITKNKKLANEKATKALEKNGGKSRVKTQKRLNAPIKNRATGRKVTK
jgi:hypothetical protein